MKWTMTLLTVGLAACGDDHAGTATDAARVDALTPADGPVADAAPTIDAAPGAPDAPLPVNGLVLRYDFEDTGTVVTDLATGHHGTLTDPAAWSEFGRTGRGLAMSGATPATQYVSLPNGILDGVDAFTIAAWVKLDATVPWARIYDIGNGLADPANRFMYLTPNGFSGPNADGVHAASYGGSAANEAIVASHSLLPNNVWKHVAVTGSGGTRTLYIDGYPVGTLTGGPTVAPHEMEPVSPNSWLGRSRFASDPGLGGELDDFRIYNRVLPQAEVADLAWPKFDYAYWRFDDGSGTTAKDSSDYAIPTALVGGATWTTGRLGGAIDLAGGAAGATGPHVVLGANPIANCTTSLTVAAWVKLRTLTPWSRVFDFGSGNTAFIYLAPTDGAGMHFAMVAPSGVFDLVSPTPPIAADGAWHHVAVTVGEGGVVTLYADGASVASATSAAVHPLDFNGVTDSWLGRSRFPDPYLDGSIDELRISCRAFTADEIADLSRR
ncbi:MAG: LamG domain-containing protein [Deltaproteobacteria bacterium]|nr:LamG domain-containing protein [Deltaproteobacteria bacterium]